MVPRHAIFLLSVFALLCVFAGCGRTTPSSNVANGSDAPIVTSVDPEAAVAGDPVTVSGHGFSFAAPENVVLVADGSGSAETYDIADDGTEILTFTLPFGLSPGETNLLVVVEGNASNAVPFNVLP
jgi:hypothetical protein